MAFTVTHNVQVVTPSGTVGGSVVSTGSGEQGVDDSIPTATTDQEVSVAFTLTALKSFVFLSDQAITLETNATDHSGGDSIAIQANKPLVWQSGGYFANPFTQAVTKFFLTNNSGSTANYSVRVLCDATP